MASQSTLPRTSAHSQASVMDWIDGEQQSCDIHATATGATFEATQHSAIEKWAEGPFHPEYASIQNSTVHVAPGSTVNSLAVETENVTEQREIEELEEFMRATEQDVSYSVPWLDGQNEELTGSTSQSDAMYGAESTQQNQQSLSSCMGQTEQNRRDLVKLMSSNPKARIC